jgi:hypothetical protein
MSKEQTIAIIAAILRAAYNDLTLERAVEEAAKVYRLSMEINQ